MIWAAFRSLDGVAVHCLGRGVVSHSLSRIEELHRCTTNGRFGGMHHTIGELIQSHNATQAGHLAHSICFFDVGLLTWVLTTLDLVDTIVTWRICETGVRELRTPS